MADSEADPDPFFRAEFGEGDLATRLWRGGLRANADGYTLLSSIRSVSTALSERLDSRDEGPISAIVSDIEACWEDVARLRRFCAPLPGAPAHTPSSLTRLLLSIDALQPALVTTVVNKLSELGTDGSGTADLAASLLAQLRWLNFLVDGPALGEAILAIVPIVTPELQRTVVEALPEILDDTARPPAVAELTRLLQDSPALTGSIIDALAALGVDDASLPEVNSSVLSGLPAVSRDILPVCLRYLLRTCPQSLHAATVNALRSTLAQASLGSGPGKLCLDAVKIGLRMSRGVADHLLKTLRGLQKPEDHRPADWWLLLALLDSPLHRKAADSVFRRKAANASFTPSLVQAALAPFADAFQPLSSRLVGMAGIALRGSEIASRRTGVVLYALLFRIFATGDTRRAVVSALLEHTGTRRPVEVDAALEALAKIAAEAEDDRALLPHSATIQGLLDFLEFFSDAQIRQIWRILGNLCRASVSRSLGSARGSSSAADAHRLSRDQIGEDQEPGAGGGELQMLEILLRKELTHVEIFYRRIGVIGACTMIKVLGNKVKNNILDLVFDVGKAYPLSQALAFDELAEVFAESGTSSKETVETIRKTVSRLFENRYLTDISKLNQIGGDDSLFPAELFGNLEDAEVDICFSIPSLVRGVDSLTEKQDAVRAMIPNLRLLCVMTASRFDGSLAEVDAIIGSPLHLPLYSKEKDLEDASSKAKEDLLLSLFTAHGWIIELLNAFAEQETDELRAKCVKRVDNLLDIKSQIAAVVPLVSRWSEVISDAYNGSRSAAGAMAGTSFANNKGSAGSKKKKKGSKEKPLSGRGSGEGNHDWEVYARQLDPSALTLIRILKPITIRYTETGSEVLREGDPSMEKVALSPDGLQFLLSELSTYTTSIIGQQVKDIMALGVAMYPSSVTSASKSKEMLGQASTDGPLQKLTTLRVALESVGSQLKHCINQMFVMMDDEEADEGLVETYRACAGLCLQIISTTLNSKILSDKMAQHLLFDVLVTIRLDGKPQIEASEPLTERDIQVAAKVGFEQLRRGVEKFFPVSEQSSEDPVEDDEPPGADLMGLEGCCAFLAAMNSLYIHCSEKDQDELGEKFSKTAMSVLKHNWSMTVLRGRKASKLIAGVVRIHVQTSSGPLRRAEWLMNVISNYAELLKQKAKKPIGITQDTDEAQRTERANDLASLTEHTSHTYNVAILEQFLALFKDFKPDSYDDTEEAFKEMERFLRAEQLLYNLAAKNQRTLGVVMRAGRSMTDLFLKNCVPYLKAKFSEHKAEVVRLCRTHQKPTRLLQSFCAHSKSLRDTSLTTLVPPLRRTLELLLYRVKEIYQAHDATAAFELGNLKHRDINGNVVNSQDMQYAEETEGNDDEDAEEEDDQEEEDEAGPGKRGGRGRLLKSATRGGKRARLNTTGARAGSAGKSKRGPSAGRPPVPPSKNAKRQKVGRQSSGRRKQEEKGSEDEESEEERRGPNTLDSGSDKNEDDEETENEEIVPVANQRRSSSKVTASQSKQRPGSSHANGRAGSSGRAQEGSVNDAEENDEENDDEDEEDDVPVRRRKRSRKYEKTQRVRNRLIDDEAGEDEGEEDEDVDEQYDLSQFIEFGDEEETEE